MNDYNLCGVLVHAKENKTEQVKQQLEQQEGVEVHAITEDGRLVVTVEGSERKTVGDRIMSFYEMPGVLSAAMIYQFSDELEEHLEFGEMKPKSAKLESDIKIKLQPTEERVSA